MDPIAGIPVDREKMTLTHLLDDGTTYAFPHVYLRLSPGFHQRFIPPYANANQLQEKGNLDIELKYSENGIIDNNLMIVVYALYDDYLNVEADLKKKIFYNPILSSPKEY